MYKKPISNKLLKDEIILETVASRDQYHNVTYNAPITVKKVYVEFIAEQSNQGQGEINTDTAFFMYDMTNSIPSGLRFPRDSRVTYKGQELFVRKEIDFAPHHYEVRLT